MSANTTVPVNTTQRRQRGGDWAGEFSSEDELNLWAAMNPNELFPGLRATVNGQAYTWR